MNSEIHHHHDSHSHCSHSLEYEKDLRRNARSFIRFWVTLFVIQVLIIQYGCFIGLRMAPLRVFDYFVSICIGIGGMGWFNLMCFLQDRYEEHKRRKEDIVNRFQQDDDNNYDSFI